MPGVGNSGALQLGLLLLFAVPAFAQSRTEAETLGLAEPSRFQMRKAERLLREKLPCLGCHELDGEGGRVGPSLSSLRGARTADYVRRIISDPQATIPGTPMPRVPVRPETRELIVAYLLYREPSREPAQAAGRSALAPGPAGADAAGLYTRFCAVCHGARGDGDGPNAEYLPVRPTAHSDPEYMSTRSDDALFDAIYAGGYVMGRSNRMPPFGLTLTRDQIEALVGYLRELCGCRGPAWSLDGR